MGRGNVNNLIVPSSEEARKNGSKGGKASGDSRREKRKLQNALQKLLAGKFQVGEDEDKKLGGYEAIAQSMILSAINGNVKAATFVRDTIGEKPVDVLDLENKDNNVTGIKISFVNKSNPNKGKEKDPKIVGDYTPPSNTEG